MRVTVALDDLEPALGIAESGSSPGAGGAASGGRSTAAGGRGTAAGGRGAAVATSNAAALRLERARTVASSLDLRGARVDEALEALGRYLDDAALAGLDRVTIIHGLGTGALRDAVRTHAAGHPLVRDLRPGERGEGGDGATIISL
jgi:hypothetical protein